MNDIFYISFFPLGGEEKAVTVSNDADTGKNTREDAVENAEYADFKTRGRQAELNSIFFFLTNSRCSADIVWPSLKHNELLE